MKIKILIHAEPPAPGKSGYPEPSTESTVEQEVRHALEMIDSGHDSVVEWKLINKLARELRGKKGKRAQNILSMIDPVLQKYGIHGSHANNDEA